MPVVRFSYCAALAATLIALAPPVAAAQSPAVGFVAGRVVTRPDSGDARPAVGATVSIAGTSGSTVTNPDGRFLLDLVPAGTRTLRIRVLGYRTTERQIRITAGDTTRVEVVLASGAQLLATVRTAAQSAEAQAFVASPNVATITMNAAAIAGVPSIGEPDIVRTVQLLPGVVARNDFNTGLNVRGGEADQNLVLLDGYPIYNPFHLGGLFSTFMDATVGGIELLTGAFPARYGGRLSSVLDVHSANDVRTDFHGSADVSALGATARLAGGFASGRGTWSVAGRRTYADAVTSIFTNNIFPYHFRDVQARGTYTLPHDVRLSVTAYTGRDILDADLTQFDTDSAPSRASEGHWAFNWGNRVIGATLAKSIGPNDRTTIEQRFSTSSFSTVLDVGNGALEQRSRIRDLRLSGLIATHTAAHDLSAGYDVAMQNVHYGSGSTQTGTTAFDLVQDPTTAAAWVDDLWRVTPQWLVQGGLRAEAITGRDWAALSPRLSLKYLVTPTLAFTLGGGRVTQTLQSLVGDGPLRYFDIWVASDSFIPVAAAWHGVAGAERRFGDAGSVRIEGYYKRYQRVLDVNRSEDPSIRGDEFFPAEGRSYGLDLFARWASIRGVSGWVAYTYGVSQRWRDGFRWAPGHDRRHDVNVVATWQRARYRYGARFGLASGTPFTPIVGGITRRVYDPARDRWGTGDPQIYVESLGGGRNSARYPLNHRLDLDASRELHYHGATVAPYLSVVNAYNAKNVLVYRYQYSNDTPTRRAISQFPILPSAGVRVAF